MPTGPADATGISNLTLRQFHGTGTNPTNYTGAAVDFTTATAGFTVTWNATRNWWEVVVPVNGFSGFYITSGPLSVLPVSLNYFRGTQTAAGTNILNWKVNCTSENVRFEIERSADNRNYAAIGTLTASKLRCAQPFESADDKPMAGINYYRIKIIDEDGNFYYSNTISFTTKTKGFIIESISPNPVKNENAVVRLQAGDKALVNVAVTDFAGRIIMQQAAQVLPGLNNITLNTQKLAAGVYQVTVYTPSQKPATIRLVKQ